MNASAILQDLARRGVSVAARGDKLRLAPASAISPELRSLLLEHKAELLTALSTSPDRAPVVAPCELLTRPPDSRERLTGYLDAWAGMDEAAWHPEAVDRLKDEILDVFQEHPGEADTWFKEWRKAHPGAKLA